MKQYISPISFLPAGAGANLTTRDLKLSRHKLMAEFELAGTSSIPVGGKEMTRNDVIRLFDDLEHATDLNYHVLVASDPALLKFLVHGEITPGDNFSLTNEQATESFIGWLSPYFAYAFSKATLRMFRDVCPQEFETLVVQPYWMTAADEFEAWRKTGMFLDNKVHEFIELNNKKYFPPFQQKQYADYNVIWLLCNLPEDRFSRLLDEYAFQMMRLSITVFNKRQRDQGFELLTLAQSLKVSPEIRSKLVAKEKEMQGIVKKSGKADTWKTVRIVLVILFILARLASCH